MFIGREAELAHLETLYASGRAELFILYGRRRVGKTELLRAFCAGKAHIFFIATLSSDRDQLAAFSQDIYRLTHAEVPEGFQLPILGGCVSSPGGTTWPSSGGLDEFTYLIGGNKAIPSILQKVWDERLKTQMSS